MSAPGADAPQIDAVLGPHEADVLPRLMRSEDIYYLVWMQTSGCLVQKGTAKVELLKFLLRLYILINFFARTWREGIRYENKSF